MSNKLNVVPYDASLQGLASDFRSGNAYLDQFLDLPISLHSGFGKTFVLLSADGKTLIGYYNIGTGYIEQVEGERVFKMGGSVHINCFALDNRYHGLLQATTEDGTRVNLSDVLLDECLQRIERIREEQVGFAFVTLSSTREGFHLYQRSGFETLEDDMNFSVEGTDAECIPMYLPLDYE